MASSCCFCGGREGRPYWIDPFGYACPSCADGFFTSRSKKGLRRLTDDDLAKIVKAQLGPPYDAGVPLKIDVADTDPTKPGPKLEVVGRGLPDRLGGRGIYTYTGPESKRVFRAATAPHDRARPRLNWHLLEWHKVRARVAWIVWAVQDERPTADVIGYYAISVQRANETGRRYDTPFGPRFGPPLEACAHYDLAFRVRKPPTGLDRLQELTAVGKS